VLGSFPPRSRTSSRSVIYRCLRCFKFSLYRESLSFGHFPGSLVDFAFRLISASAATTP
jgi:hypothetical protein